MPKIIIVDDEEIARITLADILALEGYDIQTAGSGEAAVEILGQEPFDVMLLDLKMPGVNGMDVLDRVVQEHPKVAVIILTAYGTIDTAIQAIRYQVFDYLLKPASPEQIIAAVERALQKKNTVHRVYENSLSYASKMETLPGGAALTWEKRQISWETGRLSLTPTEAKLLKILFDRCNEVIQHTELVFLIQGYQIETEEAAKILRPVVSRLRHKLSIVPEWGDRIKNVRGAGYVLEIE